MDNELTPSLDRGQSPVPNPKPPERTDINTQPLLSAPKPIAQETNELTQSAKRGSDETQTNWHQIPQASQPISQEISENRVEADEYNASIRPRPPPPAPTRTTPDSVYEDVQTSENLYSSVVDDPNSQKYEDMCHSVRDYGNLTSSEPVPSYYQQPEPRPMYYQDRGAPPAYEPLPPRGPPPLPPPQDTFSPQYQIPLNQMPPPSGTNNNIVYNNPGYAKGPVQGVTGGSVSGVDGAPMFVQMPVETPDDKPLHYTWQLILLTIVSSIGIFVCCCCGIAATVVSSIGISSRENPQRRTMAVASLVLNIIGLVITVIVVLSITIPILDVQQNADNTVNSLFSTTSTTQSPTFGK